MTDHFALLNEPRQPWLEPDELKAKFLALSAAAHPDRVHSGSAGEKQAANQSFLALNAAYNCLRDPKERLAHLLELELAAKPRDVQRIPPGTMDLFVEVGQLCRDADAFLAQRAGLTSPLLRVRLFEQGMEWSDRLNALQQRINTRREELLAELRPLNSVWHNAPPAGSPARLAALPLDRLEQLYRVFSYINRWTNQIQERVVQLAL